MRTEALAARSKIQPLTLPQVRLERWFFSFAGVAMLACVLVGFEQFYFHGRAYPNREITPPIRSLVIAHGLTMAAWILLGILQPLLVATGNRKVHRKIGVVGAGLAACVVAIGIPVGIQGMKHMPPEATLMGFSPAQFLAVPLLSLLMFGVLVAIAVWQRTRPAIHRSMMTAATLCTLSAALNRIDALNNLYVGTVFESFFGPFFMAVVLAGVLWGLRCVLVRSVDRWMGAGFAIVAVVSAAITAIAKTSAWEHLAIALMR